MSGYAQLGQASDEFARLQAADVPAYCSLFDDPLNSPWAKIFLTDTERAVCAVAKNPALTRDFPLPPAPSAPSYISQTQTPAEVAAANAASYRSQYEGFMVEQGQAIQTLTPKSEVSPWLFAALGLGFALLAGK